jgi:acetolactate synthase-1/2/3 large subunit
MKASDLLVDCLEAEDVDHVFGLPGEELEDLLFSLRDSDVQFIPVRHEQGAAFMADVHGRLTGEAGVCLSTLGPGATNLLTGVADAHLDKSPVVALTGQGSRERLHKESHQALDVVDTFEPVVEWNTQITDADTISESVRKAFKLAESEKPGATHIEFPEDVAEKPVDAEPLAQRPTVRRPDPDETSLDRAADLVEDAEEPVLLAGNGAVRTQTAERLRDLVGHAGIPVVSTYMGKGAVSDRLDCSLMTLDSGPNEEASEAIERADCVVAVGYDIAEHDPKSWNPDLETSIVHVDYEPAEVYRHYNPDVEIVADISVVLRELRTRLAESDAPSWVGDLRDRIVDDVRREPDVDDPLSVKRTLPYLREAMADDDVLISDVGSHKMHVAQSFPTYEPNTCIVSNGLASMGIAVPGGTAADLAVDSNVVVATGDGGFMMNGAEIETARRLGLGYTIVVFNDNDYGLISEKQREHTGEHFGTELTNPDFVQFAESFGIDGYRADSWSDVGSVLDEVVANDDLSLVEIPVA